MRRNISKAVKAGTLDMFFRKQKLFVIPILTIIERNRSIPVSLCGGSHTSLDNALIALTRVCAIALLS